MLPTNQAAPRTVPHLARRRPPEMAGEAAAGRVCACVGVEWLILLDSSFLASINPLYLFVVVVNLLLLIYVCN